MAETSHEVSAIFCIYLNKKVIRIHWQLNTYSFLRLIDKKNS